jgi:hypothetical protein
MSGKRAKFLRAKAFELGKDDKQVRRIYKLLKREWSRASNKNSNPNFQKAA